MTPRVEGRPSRGEVVTELRNNLRVGSLTGTIGGALLGLLFSAATLALNPGLLGSLRDVVVLVLGLGAVYTIFCLALGLLGALGKTVLFRLSGQRVSDTKTAAFVTGTVFFTIGALYGYQWCRWHRIGGLNPESHAGLDDLPIVITLLLVSALFARLLTYAFYLLLVHFKKPERARPGDLHKAFLVLAYMAGAFALFVLALRLGANGSDGSRLTQDDIRPLDAPLRVLAVDGLSTDDVARLVQGGKLASFRPLFDGAAGTVAAPEHPVAPVLWTRVATGQPLETHGIVDYQAQVVRGLSRPFTISANQVGLFQLFQDVLPFFRMTRPVPMRSYMRGSKGIWNIASDAGRECVVVNWWVSYPAERVLGSVVSDQTYLRLASEHAADPSRTSDVRSHGETYPGSLLLELVPFLKPDSSLAAAAESAQAQLSKLGIPAEVLAADLFYARAALYLLERDAPDLWLLHLPGPDVFRRVLRRDVEEVARREAAFEQALDAYWSVLGPALAPLVEDESPGGTAASRSSRRVWLSLPGWPLRDEPPRRGESRPEGRFALAGPSVEPTSLGAIALEDLCPTFLWLLGLPYSAEMLGTPRADALATGAPLGEPRRIGTFGPLPVPPEPPAADATMDRARLELLRSLGYIDN